MSISTIMAIIEPALQDRRSDMALKTYHGEDKDASVDTDQDMALWRVPENTFLFLFVLPNGCRIVAPQPIASVMSSIPQRHPQENAVTVPTGALGI